MQIYLGSVYHNGVAQPGSHSIHRRMTKRVRHPFVMESFHYADTPTLAAIRRNKQTIFLDSGAFSAHTRGVRIKLRSYADFISANADIIRVAANLDLIGPGNERWTYQRQKALETMLASDGLGQLIIPVHHLRDHFDWLRRYLDDGYRYIGLGGLVGESPSLRRRWLDHVWRQYLTHTDGTPKVKVHGFGCFGLASAELMFRYPWHSLDSTTWIKASHYGGSVWLDFPQADGGVKDYEITFAENGYGPRHYRALAPADRKLVDRRLEQLEAERIRDPEIEAAFKAERGCVMGFNPTALGCSYGLRDLANIGYFYRAMARGVDRFEQRRTT
jgi:hypothetical protein